MATIYKQAANAFFHGRDFDSAEFSVSQNRDCDGNVTLWYYGLEIAQKHVFNRNIFYFSQRGVREESLIKMLCELNPRIVLKDGKIYFTDYIGLPTYEMSEESTYKFVDGYFFTIAPRCEEMPDIENKELIRTLIMPDDVRLKRDRRAEAKEVKLWDNVPITILAP